MAMRYCSYFYYVTFEMLTMVVGVVDGDGDDMMVATVMI